MNNVIEVIQNYLDTCCDKIAFLLLNMYHFFLECQSLFLRHRKTGKCIATGELVYEEEHAKPYFAIMIKNCLNSRAQFRYLETELLQNIDTNGTLVSSTNPKYTHRWAIYKGIQGYGLTYQRESIHRLKQTDAGILLLYNMKKPVCAEPLENHVIRNQKCDKGIQKFTFGKSKFNEVWVKPKFLHVTYLPMENIFVTGKVLRVFNEKI